MTAVPTLFDLPEPKRHDRAHDGPCATCGATRPDGYNRPLWLEPVSLECLECNHATLTEITEAEQAGDRRRYEAAWQRHYPPLRMAPRRRP